MRLVLTLSLSCMLFACDTPEDDPVVEEEEALSGMAAVACGDAEAAHRFKTEDGVRLEADYWPAADADAPAVVLLHMTPDGPFNRGDYPPRVRQQLHDLGMGVLALDRRGAGGSKGEGRDAYLGEGGRLDVEAAVRQLLGAGCAMDAERLFLVGASNGTTSVFDYTASHADDLPDAAAVVFMSPGDYTEAQHQFASTGPFEIPWLWLYPTNEPWSTTQVDGAASSWEFVERGNLHGTQMFDGGQLEDDTMADITRVLGAASE